MNNFQENVILQLMKISQILFLMKNKIKLYQILIKNF